MKLPDIKLGGAARSNTITPGQAASPSLSRMNALNQGINAASRVVAEKQKERDEAAAIAAHTKYVEEVGRYEVAIAGLDDEVDREELLILGLDESNQDINWSDGDKPRQTFKKHEVEAAIMSNVLDSKAMAAAESMPESMRDQWLADTKQRNAKYLVDVNKRSVAAEKKSQEREALATLNSLETPEAIMAFVDASPDIDPVVKEQWRNKAEQELFIRDTNAVLNNGSMDDLDARLEQLTDPDYRKESGIGETKLQQATASVKAEKERRLREQDRAEGLSERAQLENAKESWKGVESALKSSVAVPDEEWDKALSATAGTDYYDSVAMARKGQSFLLEDAATQQEMLASTDNFADAQEHGYLSAQYAQLQKNLDDDGFATAVAQGIIPEPSPMDLTDPSWGNERQRQAELASIHYGRPISPFTQAEVDSISATIPSMTSQEQARLAMSFSDMPEVWEQFDAAGAGVFAQTGAMGDANIAARALEGQKRINNKDFIPPTRKELVMYSQDYLGNAYGPEDKQRVIDTALALYASDAPTGEEGEFSQDAWENALREAGGNAVDINGHKVIAARDLQDPDALEDFADNFSEQELAMFGSIPGYTDSQAVEMIQEGQWVSAGEGKYKVVYGNNELQGEDGPYLITFNNDVHQQLLANGMAARYDRRRVIPRFGRR